MNSLSIYSQSRILMFDKCAEQFRRRYILNEIRPPGIRMLRGTGIHRASQHNFSQKIESHQDLKISDISDYAISEFDTRINKEGVYLAPDERSRGMNVVVSEERDRVWRLSNLFGKSLAPIIQPISVEAKVSAEFDSLGFTVEGTIDLITIEKAVRDIKSSVKSRSKGDQHSDFQLTTYAALYYALNKEMPSSLGLDVLVDLKTSPKLQQLETTRTLQDFIVWFAKIEATHKAITAGNFPPTNSQNWWCNPRWCGYWEDCKYISDSERSRILNPS